MASQTLLKPGLSNMATSTRHISARLLHTPLYCNGDPTVSNVQRRLRLMPLGGSITQGVGSNDRNGYREALVNILNANKYDVEMVGTRNTGTMTNNSHEGWRGFRIDEIDKKARRCVSELRPTLFAINAGSNDCLQDYELSCAGYRMNVLLEYLWTTAPGSTVILSTLVVNRHPKIDSRVDAVNHLFRKLVHQKAAEHRRIVLADMYTPEGPSYEDLGNDGTHPGSAGYHKMAGVWYKAIEEAAERGYLGQS